MQQLNNNVARQPRNRVRKVLGLGDGMDFSYVDRETVRVAHAYLAFQVKDTKAGAWGLEPLADPAIGTMMKPYSKFRFRSVSVSWMPVVSVLTSGVVAIECSAAAGTMAVPTLTQLAGTPGAHVGPISSKGVTHCDVRSYGTQWFTVVGGKGDVMGLPSLLWCAETASTDALGYLVVSYVLEFSAPIFSPVPNRDLTVVGIHAEIDRLRASVEALTVEPTADTAARIQDDPESN
jgi:hypothetical protein